jgi:hypothetical protein
MNSYCSKLDSLINLLKSEFRNEVFVFDTSSNFHGQFALKGKITISDGNDSGRLVCYLIFAAIDCDSNFKKDFAKLHFRDNCSALVQETFPFEDFCWEEFIFILKPCEACFDIFQSKSSQCYDFRKKIYTVLHSPNKYNIKPF